MTANSSLTGDQVLKGLQEIVKELRSKLPNSKLIIIGHTPYTISRIQTAATHNNQVLKSMADNNNIYFFDLTSNLTDSSGNQLANMFRTDHLHLSAQGYGVWDQVMRPTFEKLLNQ